MLPDLKCLQVQNKPEAKLSLGSPTVGLPHSKISSN